MKKRIRKKLHIKEFTQYGIEFNITFSINEKIDNDNLMYDFITLIENNHTFCGGGGDDKEWGMIVEINKKYHTADQLSDIIKNFFFEKLEDKFEYNFKVIDLWKTE